MGGSGKDVGKTALVCGIIAALPEFAWTAVKITGHDYEPETPGAMPAAISNRTIWEETTAGTETDTARYLSAGARRALLVKRVGPDVPADEIRLALGSDRNVIFESNRILDAVKPDVCIAVMGQAAAVKDSFRQLLSIADAVVTTINASAIAAVPAGILQFHLQSLDRISPEMANWLRARANAPSTSML